ncbi:endonuclease VIII [Prochlorococcus sp. MIT 0916]|uniref:endonuclease VIII n=1 Tax=Prochlorococcus sp. MIT 0916 TaxID=3082521 RepID=UPI0039B46516
MPEGPEIRRAGDRISRALVDKEIVKSNFYYVRIKDREEIVKNKNIKEITTRGKAMLIRFKNGWTMYSHNQLYGRWTVNLNTTKIKSTRALRVVFKTKKHTVRLWSATDIDLLPTSEEHEHSFLKKIGPDVLNESCSYKLIEERLTSKTFHKKKASTLMLDQTVFAGLGNYLRSEILFDAKIHPDDRPFDLDKTRITQWAKSIKNISHLAYKTGGFTVSKYIADRNKENGEPRKSYRHAVFMRYQYECLNCKSRIERKWYGKRKLDFCPSCQIQTGKIKPSR